MSYIVFCAIFGLFIMVTLEVEATHVHLRLATSERADAVISDVTCNRTFYLTSDSFRNIEIFNPEVQNSSLITEPCYCIMYYQTKQSSLVYFQLILKKFENKQFRVWHYLGSADWLDVPQFSVVPDDDEKASFHTLVEKEDISTIERVRLVMYAWHDTVILGCSPDEYPEQISYGVTTASDYDAGISVTSPTTTSTTSPTSSFQSTTSSLMFSTTTTAMSLTETTPYDEDKDMDDSKSLILIISLAVVCGTLLIVVCVCLIIYIRHRKRKSRKNGALNQSQKVSKETVSQKIDHEEVYDTIDEKGMTESDTRIRITEDGYEVPQSNQGGNGSNVSRPVEQMHYQGLLRQQDDQNYERLNTDSLYTEPDVSKD